MRRIEKRHKGYRKPILESQKFELIQRIIILLIIISCIALVAAFLGLL